MDFSEESLRGDGLEDMPCADNETKSLDDHHAQCVESWPTGLQQAIVGDAAIVPYTELQLEDEIGDLDPLTLLLSE